MEVWIWVSHIKRIWFRSSLLFQALDCFHPIPSSSPSSCPNTIFSFFYIPCNQLVATTVWFPACHDTQIPLSPKLRQSPSLTWMVKIPPNYLFSSFLFYPTDSLHFCYNSPRPYFEYRGLISSHCHKGLISSHCQQEKTIQSLREPSSLMIVLFLPFLGRR